jgi:hypothetical protein
MLHFFHLNVSIPALRTTKKPFPTVFLTTLKGKGGWWWWYE